MVLRRFLGFTAIAFAISSGPALSQTADENRDADALAADMRILAANPLDIEALITAGELTLKMGDNTAAAGFFTRAEKLDPLNPRLKAGRAALMVRAERPGQALLLFQQAEARGLDPRKFAADRGLAYDLIGEQERAQRDYRLALQAGANDEVTRRYALSLGISGRKREAFDLLEPLLKRSDRAAWRDRAFVLAMSGDTVGAQKIADTMMSPGLGRGLAPFFERLPMLSPVDRAFAVTFGELRSTPERVADARMTPSLPKLGPDPYAPREVASAEPVKLRFADDDKSKKKRKKKKGDDDLAPAVPTPAPPVEVAMNPPSYVPPRTAPPVYVQPLPTPKPPSPRVVMSMPPAPKPVPAPTPAPPPVKVAETPKPKPTPLPPPVKVETPQPGFTPAVTPPPPAPVEVAAVAPSVADQPSAAEAGVSPTATSRVSEDTVLAKIIAGIGVPASELGVEPMPAKVAPPPPPPPPPPKPVAKVVETKTTKNKVAKDEAEPETGAKSSKLTKGKTDPADTKSGKGKTELVDAKGTKGKTAKDDAVALDKNGCPLPVKTTNKGKAQPAPTSKSRTATTTRGKAVDAKCKTADAKDGKDKADTSTKGEPARVWVQVAGGANESSLQKAWANLREKAPDLFRNRSGWTTPLRNTNRVLAGPFKSVDEAQGFVNQMSKAGLSGFVFTSAKGQKIDRLGAK